MRLCELGFAGYVSSKIAGYVSISRGIYMSREAVASRDMHQSPRFAGVMVLIAFSRYLLALLLFRSIFRSIFRHFGAVLLFG